MNKYYLIICSLLFAFSAEASHIIGGNLKITQTSNNEYLVDLLVFRNCGIGNPNDKGDDPVALQNTIVIRVFDALTYSAILTDTFSRGNETNIALGNACYSPPNLCVEEYIFSKSLQLPNNPNGYIISAQSCCRNYSILNLNNPSQTGITWQATIPDPALIGRNSSPDLGPYPSLGFLCVLTELEINLSATDVDGDSLVYELITPFNAPSQGNSSTQFPPFHPVNWKQGYSALNAIPGNPALTMDRASGVLRCKASQLGVYVIAYKVLEYRNGLMIGEIVRDLQLEVLNCTPAMDPEILEPKEAVYTMNSNDELCLNFYALDSNSADTLYFEAIYSGSVLDYSEGPEDFFQIGFGQAGGEVCWKPNCLGLVGDQTLHIELRLTSLGCYAPQHKTKHIDIIIENPEPEINSLFPNVFTPNGDQINDHFKPSDISENDCLDFLQYKIYNRWGDLLFETNESSGFWDGNFKGRPVVEGVYYYVANGSYLGKVYNFSSHITLIR